ncbi:Protein phosphatase Slingshot 1 [Phytophthora citrophthora]|uniref:protein-tyrosine-phosphatase n=1 Tax=Phytophthora citrophthora TaxID=4793 RepID=A0AAD9G1C9_9STRA|nr:Protein phosphatase Slingshot 1 [Phytophthora citrophthora]
MIKQKGPTSSTRIASGALAPSSISFTPSGLQRQKSSQTLKKYASTRKFNRRHELQREGEHVRNTSIVVYSKRNPDEEDAVMAAQWRVMEALAQEQSIFKRLAAFIGRTLGTASCQDPTVILNHVLLGNRENAADSRLLNLLGITHICNCAAQIGNSFEGEFIYLKLNLHDSQDEELIPHFQTVTKFIKRVERLRGRVLLHCISGASRSPALLIAYLMIDKKMPLLEAYNMVKRKRHIVQPNQAFRLQLAKYELMLFGASSVATTPDKDWNFYAWNEVKNERGLRRK